MSFTSLILLEVKYLTFMPLFFQKCGISGLGEIFKGHRDQLVFVFFPEPLTSCY